MTMNELFAALAIVIAFGSLMVLAMKCAPDEPTIILTTTLPTSKRSCDRPVRRKLESIERLTSGKTQKSPSLTSNGLLVAAAVFAGVVVVGYIGAASRKNTPAKAPKPRLPKSQQHLHLVPDLVPPADEPQP